MYISWESGEMIKGPVVVNRSYLISEIPVFSKAGCIIPMRTNGFRKLNLLEFADFKNPFLTAVMGSAQMIPDSIKFVIFTGTANQ